MYKVKQQKKDDTSLKNERRGTDCFFKKKNKKSETIMWKYYNFFHSALKATGCRRLLFSF